MKSGRYFRTGAFRSILPCSTSRIIIVAAKVFEIEAIGKTVCSVTGSGSSTLVTPSPRVVITPLSRMPIATPGTLILAHLRLGQRDDGVELRVRRAFAPTGVDETRARAARMRTSAFHDGGIIVGLMRSWLIAAALVAVRLPRASAHEKFKIVGSVVAVKSDEIAVKAIDGATYEIDMPDSTVVTDKNHKKLDREGTEGRD